MTNPPENSVLLNVCLIPPEDIGDKCVTISQSLESEDTQFVLGDDKFAHMTVYMARFPESATGQVLNGVKEVLSKQAPLLLRHTGYFMTEGRYVEVSYERTPELLALHEDIIRSVSHYRINPGNPHEEGYFTPYTQEQQRNAQETGYDLAFDLYRPHITLTRYKEGKAPNETPVLPDIDLSFDLGQGSACVYKADDNGAVYEQLAEFRVG